MAKNEARETRGQGESVGIAKGHCHELRQVAERSSHQWPPGAG